MCAELKISIEKVAAFGSDGASVMVGIHNGVAALLKGHVPHLVSIYCVAALAISHATKSVPFIARHCKQYIPFTIEVWFAFLLYMSFSQF